MIRHDSCGRPYFTALTATNGLAWADQRPKPSVLECKKVCQNIVFALAVKAVCLVLGALGIANMWVAIFADVGVMVLCVLNAARALNTKHL